MLTSEKRKLEKVGLKINTYTDINGYRYWLDSNMGNRYFTLRVCKIDKGEKPITLCTRANLGTALDKAQAHIIANA